MPLHIALILLGLFAACVAVVLLGWWLGSEFYVFLPVRRIRAISTPPTHPVFLLVLLATCVALYFYSPQYSLVFFTALLVCLLLGSLIGYGVFAWKPTVMQFVLTLVMAAEAICGWSVRGDYLDY